jgi:hypothetical protein
MKPRKKIKFELTHASNGYIVGMVNPLYNGPGSNEEFYKETFVGNNLEELFQALVAQFVVERMVAEQ